MPTTFITLTCPTCGAKLQITEDMQRFACAHCGSEHVVRRDGGTIALKPLVDSLNSVRSSVDRTAAELAIKRLKEEKAELAKRGAQQRHLQRELTRTIAVSAVSALFGILFFLASVNQQNGAGCAVVSVLLVLGMGAVCYLNIRRHQRAGDEWKRLSAEYEACEQKIQKHKKIADG